MTGAKEKLQLQVAKDETDLKTVVIGTYVFAGFYAVMAALGTVWLAMNLMGLITGYSSAYVIVPSILMIASAVVMSCLNLQSAKAITARESPHISFFVAGIDTAVFPIGTILGIWSYQVLARPSVQDLYTSPLRGAPALPKSETKKQDKKVRLVVSDTANPAEPEPMQFHEAMSYADQKEEEMWKALEEEHHRKSAGEESKEG